MEVYVTGHSHNYASTLHYLYYGAYNTNRGSYNQAHANLNGITKRNELISGYQCHQSYKGALKDFHHYLRQKPNNRVQTLNIILSFSKKDFDFRKPNDCAEASVIAQDFAHRAFPDNIGVLGFQEDNTNAIPHIHLDLCSIKMNPPYNTISGREYGIYHLRRIGKQCINDFNNNIVNGRKLSHPFTHKISGITRNNSSYQRQKPSFRQSRIMKAINSVIYNPAVNSPSKLRNALKPYGIHASFKRRHSRRIRRHKRRGRYKRSGLTFRYETKDKNGKTRRHYVTASSLARIDPIYSYLNITKRLSTNRIIYRKRSVEAKREHKLQEWAKASYKASASSASQSLSVSKSASERVSASMSVSNSQSASLSLSASYSASTSTSQSQAKFVSAERSVSAVLSSSASASRASSASYSASISQSASLSASTSASYSASVSMSNASMSASSALSASSVAQSDYDSVKELGFNDKIDTMNRLANMDTENDRHISVWNYHNAVPVLASGTRDKEVLKPIRKSYRKMDTRKDRNSLHTAVDSLLHTFKSDICIGYHRLESVYQGVKAYCNANKHEVPNTQYDKWGDPVYYTKNATLERFKKYAKLSSLKVWGFGGKVKKLTKQSHMLNIVYKFSSKVSHAVDKGISPVYSHFDKVRKEKALQKQLKMDLVEDKKIQRSKAQSNAVQASMARSVDEQATLNHDRSVESSEALNRISRANHKQHREKVAYYKKHPKEFQKHEKEVARQRKSAIQRSRNNNGPEMS